MIRFIVAFILFLFGLITVSQAVNLIPLLGASASKAKGSASYTGPGDVVSGASTWWGLRAYNLAYATGSNNAIDIVRASDSATASIKILSTGALDTATASTFCNATICTVSKAYDQTGNGNHVIQATVGKQPTLTFNCLGTNPCLTFSHSAATSLVASVTYTQAQPISFETVLNRNFDGTANPQAAGIGSQLRFGFATAANTFRMDSGAPVITLAATDGSWHAGQGVFSTSVGAIAVDGTISNTNTGSRGATGNDFELGSSANIANFNGTLTEAGWWPIGFSNGQITSLNSNAHSYWGF